MDVYLAIIEDRHSDVDVAVFSTLDLAIEYARGTAREYATREQDVIEQEPKGDWLFAVTYSIEGDWIRVVKATVDEPEA